MKQTTFRYALKWLLTFGAVFCASKLDEPLMFKWRMPAALILIILSVIFALRTWHTLSMTHSRFLKRCERFLFLMVLISTMIIMSRDAVVYHYKKHAVLTSPPALLKTLGRHIIVGYRDPEEVICLIRKQAVGGVYVTSRNIRNKSLTAVRSEIQSFQNSTEKNGLPPLFIAADQEGGSVSRLSPLLQPMPSLSSVAGAASGDVPADEKIKTYAETQAHQLVSIGINLNLSPVVDLKTDDFSHKLNLHSRIDQRAISASMDTVTEVAGVYCSTLLRNGVRPTLKHFPGLGSVSEDTHFSTGTLNGTRSHLEENDWYPFREITSRTAPFIMLGHVCVPAVDPDLPASLSEPIISGIIRNDWKFEGVLITDDFNMGAIAGREEGMGKSAVRALNAGADLILLSYDGTQYYPVMYELLKAFEKGILNPETLKKSRHRLYVNRPEALFPKTCSYE